MHSDSPLLMGARLGDFLDSRSNVTSGCDLKTCKFYVMLLLLHLFQDFVYGEIAVRFPSLFYALLQALWKEEGWSVEEHMAV